jgi:hypothetical protein
MRTIEEISKEHAIECHKLMGHKYDGEDYEVHLKGARDNGERYKHHIPLDDQDDVFASIWHHDTLEDCSQICNFAQLVKTTNLRVALIVKAVSTGEGTRKERFSDEHYRGIRNTKYATFDKLCDRIHNVSKCVNGTESWKVNLLKMYKKEHEHFKEMLYVAGEYEDMWKELDDLLS